MKFNKWMKLRKQIPVPGTVIVLAQSKAGRKLYKKKLKAYGICLVLCKDKIIC